jgi:hypothetical protein
MEATSDDEEDHSDYKMWPKYGLGKYRHMPYKGGTIDLIEHYIRECPHVPENHEAILAACRALKDVEKEYRKEESESSSYESEYSSSEDVVNDRYGGCGFYLLCGGSRKKMDKMDALKWELGLEDEESSLEYMGLRDILEFGLLTQMKDFRVDQERWEYVTQSLNLLADEFQLESDEVSRTYQTRRLEDIKTASGQDKNEMQKKSREAVMRVGYKISFCERIARILKKGIDAIKVCMPHYQYSIKTLQEYKRYRPRAVDLTNHRTTIQNTREKFRRLLETALNGAVVLYSSDECCPWAVSFRFDKAFSLQIHEIVKGYGDCLKTDYSSSEDIPVEYRRGPRTEEDFLSKAKHRAMAAQLGVRNITRKQELRIRAFGLRNALDHHRDSTFFKKERHKERAKRRESKRYKHEKEVRKKREQRKAEEREKWAHDYDSETNYLSD